MSTNGYQASSKVILIKDLSTPGDHVKSGCFKQSQFWANKLLEKLTPEEIGQLAKFSIAARYNEDGIEYDAVTRNPGVFANDILNRHLKSLDFPNKQFYTLMNNPDANEKEIKIYIEQIPDKVIDSYVQFYHEFKKDPKKMEGKTEELQDRQFLALAAFGAMTWRVDEFISDPAKRQEIKKNITNFKNKKDNPFDPIIQKIKEKEKEYATALKKDGTISNLSPDLEEKIISIVNNPVNIQEAKTIQAYNDPFFKMIDVLRGKYTNAGPDYKKQANEITELYAGVIEQRQTGNRIDDNFAAKVMNFLQENISNISLNSVSLNAVEDFVKTPALSQLMANHSVKQITALLPTLNAEIERQQTDIQGMRGARFTSKPEKLEALKAYRDAILSAPNSAALAGAIKTLNKKQQEILNSARSLKTTEALTSVKKDTESVKNQSSPSSSRGERKSSISIGSNIQRSVLTSAFPKLKSDAKTDAIAPPKPTRPPRKS